MGDDAAFLKGKLSFNESQNYKKCFINIYIQSNGFHLLKEEISEEFEVSFSVSPSGSNYIAKIDCENHDDQFEQLFSKILKLGGGISSADIGEIKLMVD